MLPKWPGHVFIEKNMLDTINFDTGSDDFAPKTAQRSHFKHRPRFLSLGQPKGEYKLNWNTTGLIQYKLSPWT